MECVNCDCVNKVMNDFESGARLLLKKAKRVSAMSKMKTVYKERQRALLLAEQEKEKKTRGYVYNKYAKKAEAIDFDVPSLETYSTGTTRTDHSPVGTRLSIERSSDASITGDNSDTVMLTTPNKATPHPIVRSPDASITTYSYKTSPTVSPAQPTKLPIERSSSASITTYSLNTSDVFKTSTVVSPKEEAGCPLVRSSSGSLTGLLNATTNNCSVSTDSTISKATTPVLPSIRDFVAPMMYTKKYAMRQGNFKENRVLKVMLKPSLGGTCEAFFVFLDANAQRSFDLWLTVVGGDDVRQVKLNGKVLKRVEDKKN